MYDFKKTESDVRKFWHDHKIFEKSLEKTRKGKRFVFWEGPPTANGLPHTGHFLTRIYKDLYGRYKTMRGFFVLRKAGWDTHGLPVEVEVEKELGFTNKKQIEEYGIAKFNRKARESVWKYRGEWERMTKQMGFWLDMEHPYVTYESSYIESIWHILQEIWNKGLLYQAHKIVPFCTRCGTPLSAHEVAQGYKTVTDKSVTVKFLISNSEFLNKFQVSSFKVYILAWTTTPWTLPGNVALAVGNDIDYVLAKVGEEIFILAEASVDRIFGPDTKYEILDTKYKGSDLVGTEYEPLFDIEELKSANSYKVYDAEFVSTEDGTGVVHTAVMYGADDYELGIKHDLPKFHTVDEQGKFTDVVSDGLAGKYVKNPETEQLVIRQLEIRNLLFKIKDFEHEYPFCWRCDSPLIYYAKNSWFIKTSAVNKELLANNETINWIPGHVKDGRFGEWLRAGKDWALSRERYWGTPLPIWICDQPARDGRPGCEHKAIIGSIKELEKLSVGAKNTYYVMRHGATNRNEATEMIVNSRLETDRYHLTEEGKAQIERSLELLKLEGVDFIYASPFNRTKETAEVAARILHKTFETDERLGELKHQLIAEDKPQLVRDIEDLGESREAVHHRLADFMADLESKHKNKKILIVTHGGPLAFLQGIAQGMRRDEFDKVYESFLVTTAEIRKLPWRKIPRNEYGELDLHRPFIDNVAIKCPKCKSKMKKVPDLIDVWFDSGAMPYAQWHYPFENKQILKQQFPADFIVEGMDQTRGWFYTLLAISTLLGKGAPYRNVMALGFTLDGKGVKESKSKGNYMPVPEIMDLHGVDILRWYFASTMTAGENKAVIHREIDDKLKGFFFTLQNSIRFYELYAPGAKRESDDKKQKPTALDKWILSRLNRLISSVTADLDAYNVAAAARAIEYFAIEDLSNWWIRRSRKRKEALPLLRIILLDLAKLIAPFAPFVAEDMWSRLQGNREVSSSKFQGSSESVHLADWPKVIKKYIKDDLEKEMAGVKEVVAAGLAQRKEKQLKVRQPLASVSLKPASPMLGGRDKFSRELEGLIKEEINVKKVVYNKEQAEMLVYDLKLTSALISEGYARELMRQIQDMRKEAKYRMNEVVTAHWQSDDKAIAKMVGNWAEEIRKDTLAVLEQHPKDNMVYDIEKETELALGKKIWLGIKNG